MTQVQSHDSAADRQPATEAVQRFAASIEYDGSHYHGWQAQRSGIKTVQRAVEAAISEVADHPLTVICAGRTDTGVHGCNQIIHFDSSAKRSERSWVFGANSNLPNDISVRWVKPVDDSFHARFSAVYRRYRYVILNTPVRPAHLPKGVTWNYRPLDVTLMSEAAQALKGEHDFSSFRAIGCQAKSPVKTIQHFRVERFGDLIVIDVKANAFLHHMVRNIAGVLMAIGCGKRPVGWVEEVLTARDRTQGGVTAPPYGLYFVDVGYPEQFDLPSPPLGPYFLSPWLAD
ncbi:tRNA pseudouridine(38-40) synthase TruA [Spartinivicinus poritis]|uniref:tRNA pseudouridine synthase A n=1 Tax=Spartinivicinus poritis TaxID=2994640 RepID=A0ABT5U7L7_9GAMM|nr:tRNA pseudouridine(38-40) synthase TruA [Spartinivicinus sp. A2-2]MDE1461144.1 tRNA pseudouridine(38-40) synthase TruA [Spartinivicinus sp. A2-2]